MGNCTARQNFAQVFRRAACADLQALIRAASTVRACGDCQHRHGLGDRLQTMPGVSVGEFKNISMAYM